MKFINQPTMRSVLLVLCLAALLNFNNSSAIAQQPTKPPADEVVRVNTELVQTAITVVDKGGHFVDGLDRGQFELTVDGQRRELRFFERVTAGSAREEQITTRAEANSPPIKAPASGTTVRGRAIVFFIDDLHLSPDSMHRTRDMLRLFLDHEMSSRDSVAIASASGQVGFLQQFTSDPEVLNAAIERLVPRPYDVRGYGMGTERMKEFDALLIDSSSSSSKSNTAVLSYYIGECMATVPPKTIAVARAALARSCETQVRNSARAILTQAGSITQNTYVSLESLMRSSARAPGRKLAFFISDGFLMDAGPRAPELRDKLDHIIDSARRAGVVVYTIDARGLIGNGIDITQGRAKMDFGAPVGEIEATQDALNALAEDTGGRALRNQNYFDRWVSKVLEETSNYYLLAWRPDAETEKSPRFRSVKVSIAGRPELTARAPRGFVEGPPPAAIAAAEAAKSLENHAAETPETALGNALADYYPSDSLPVVLSLTYLNTPTNETVLTSSIQIASRSLGYGDDGKQPATIKLAGVILTDKGKIAASFKNQLNVNPLNDRPADGAGIIYNQRTPMAPGIYQVRVAARDAKSGRVGSAMQWIVIPDLGTHQLTLSSLLLGGQVLGNPNSKDDRAQIQLSVDHRFQRAGHLGYWVFVYNAKRDVAGAPNLTMQTQVLRDGRVILNAPQRTVNNGAPDPNRIPFGQDMLLQTLAPGKYDLRVTITDTLAGTSVTRSADFEVR
jgi:VWFA-related protein